MLAHMVYFSLQNPQQDREKFIAACHKHLSGHPGVVFYAAGTCATQYMRDVNDRDFDVALQLVFQSHEAHDVYQSSARHEQFIAECRPLWKSVRVFDAEVAAK
jgi:quinol monooxygenase YgiN